MNSPARRTDAAPGRPLADGESVGVIGGGPAGAFFALHLLSLLKEAGRSARIVLIDRKSFESSGPSGCNMCAGAIGAGMVGKLDALGLALDESVVRRIADGYEIHGRDVSVTVDNPGRGGIYTVFRGGGPVAPAGGRRSFDQYLLDAAVSRGAEFLHERVEEVQIDPGGARLTFAGGKTVSFDFIVGAFGVNSALTKKLSTGYEPPRTWHTVQAEIPADDDFIRTRLRNRIHIVPARGRSIRFLAITPKDDFLTLTGIGEHVRIADLLEERAGNAVLAGLLPAGKHPICHCHPQVPVGYARKPYADRVAIVGDAFISRYLKNGIESSCDTARILAEAIVFHGVDAASLRAHFYAPCMRKFRYDNVWGKALFGIYESLLRKGRLSDAFFRTATGGADAGMSRQGRILWSVFAGDSPYREIAREALTARSLGEIVRSIVLG